MAINLIISHKYRFIFIKTSKTAGSSIEVFLAGACDENDVITPIYPEVPGHTAQNYQGYFNPIREIIAGLPLRSTMSNLLKRRKFYNHITGIEIQNRISKNIWDNYYKFCFDRSTTDKLISLYKMLKQRKIVGSVNDFIQDGHYKRVDNRRYYWHNNKKIIDDVLDFNDLHGELDRVLKLCGVPLKTENVPHIKRSSTQLCRDDVAILTKLGKELKYDSISNR